MLRVLVFSLLVSISMTTMPVNGQEDGHFGKGHQPWHEEYYSKLQRPDGMGSCCNMTDCRPTQLRFVGDHYEVKMDGVWVTVPWAVIVKSGAPDGEAHICAPPQQGALKGKIYCVVLPALI